MTNRTKEYLVVENEIMRKILFKCKTCKGRGKLDDAEPGDISFREWDCPDCKGFDANKAMKELAAAHE